MAAGAELGFDSRECFFVLLDRAADSVGAGCDLLGGFEAKTMAEDFPTGKALGVDLLGLLESPEMGQERTCKSQETATVASPAARKFHWALASVRVLANQRATVRASERSLDRAGLAVSFEIRHDEAHGTHGGRVRKCLSARDTRRGVDARGRTWFRGRSGGWGSVDGSARAASARRGFRGRSGPVASGAAWRVARGVLDGRDAVDDDVVDVATEQAQDSGPQRQIQTETHRRGKQVALGVG